jgi:hypothetical protein
MGHWFDLVGPRWPVAGTSPGPPNYATIAAGRCGRG